jgi:hypothetical protein
VHRSGAGAPKPPSVGKHASDSPVPLIRTANPDRLAQGEDDVLNVACTNAFEPAPGKGYVRVCAGV